MENVNIDENTNELVLDIVKNIEMSRLTYIEIEKIIFRFKDKIVEILVNINNVSTLELSYISGKCIRYYVSEICNTIQKTCDNYNISYSVIYLYLLWYVQKINNKIKTYYTSEELQNDMNDYILNEEFSNEKIIKMVKEINAHKELENKINGVKNGNG